jgi:hypothetical protein
MSTKKLCLLCNLIFQTALCSFGQHADETISDSLVNSLLREIIYDSSNYIPRNNETYFRKKIFDHFIKWDSLTFDFPEDSLPQTERQRRFMLEDEHEVYNEYYVFCYPFTDTVFTMEDRAYMLKQSINKRTVKFWTLLSPDIELISNSKRGLPMYCSYTFPIFSKNKKYAVIEKQTHYQWHGRFPHISTEKQRFYYENKSGKGWTIIYKSGIWVCD